VTLRAEGHVLQLCPECKAEVPDWAEACPRCGHLFAEKAVPTFCAACRGDVLPVWRGGNTTMRYCPRCQRPMTILEAPEVGLRGTILLFLTVVAFVVAAIARLLSR